MTINGFTLNIITTQKRSQIFDKTVLLLISRNFSNTTTLIDAQERNQLTYQPSLKSILETSFITTILLKNPCVVIQIYILDINTKRTNKLFIQRVAIQATFMLFNFITILGQKRPLGCLKTPNTPDRRATSNQYS